MSASEHVIAEMATEEYSPARSEAFWRRYEPKMLDFLRELESRERWVANGIGEAETNLTALITQLPSRGQLPEAALATLMRILASLPYGQSIHALLWLQARNTPAVRDVLSYTFQHRKDIATANVMWQRLERVSRFHVLSGLVSDLTGQPGGIIAQVPQRALPEELLSDGELKSIREMPHLFGSRRLAVMLNEDSLPFLNEERVISSLNEVDEIFGNRRFYLLTENMDLCKSLASCGVNVDQYGGYVTRGPACDFDQLDQLLPYVARRSVKPLFGDLIPYSSWASNLSRLLTRSCWDRIRRPIIEATGNRCEICGAKESGKDIDCHERWDYYEPMTEGRSGVQRLAGMWVMCAECHATQHLTRSNTTGRGAEALDRLRRIGRMSEREAQAYKAFVFDRLERRSRYSWSLDLSLIANSEPLVVHSAWTHEPDGFLSRENQVSETKTVKSRTLLLGAAWVHSAKDSKVQAARAVEDGYYE